MKKWVISKHKWWHRTADADVAASDIIELTSEQYEELITQFRQGCKEFYVEDSTLKIRDMELPVSQETYDAMETDIEAKQSLANTDWKVIRELEKLYLADTDLHTERQSLRDSIKHANINNDINSIK